jgi:transcriptional regulator GlxA family with amidase domain
MPHTPKKELVQKAVDFILKDIRVHHHVTTIAAHLIINANDLERWFKEEHKTGTFGFLKRKRMEHAIYLLQQTDKDIKSIAAECGYSSASALYNRFKNYFPHTPKWYRDHPGEQAKFISSLHDPQKLTNDE